MRATAAAAQTQDPAQTQQAPGQDQNQSQTQNQTQNQTPIQSSDEITAVPNRPTFATTAEAVQRGVLEIEHGFEAGDGHQNMNELLKFGLFSNLELRLANNPWERDASVSGFTDTGIGFKFKVFPQKGHRPTFSLLYTATLPTATHDLGTGATGHSVQVLVSKDFGKHHFDVNEGVQFVGRPGIGGYDRNYFTALSYSHPLRGKWAYTAEIAGFSKTNASTPASMVLLAAPTYSPSPRLVLDAGAYIGVYGNLPRITFFVGATYAIADLYRSHSSRTSENH